MQPAQERHSQRDRVRGTVQMVAERSLALILMDDGSLTIVRQLDGAPFFVGDRVTGLAQERRRCVLRNETSTGDVTVVVEVLGVTLM